MISPSAGLLRFLRKRGKGLGPLLILTHDHPDPDAIASAQALAHLVRGICRVPSQIVHGGMIGRRENQTMVRILRIPVRPLQWKVDFRKFRSVALVDTQPGFGNNSFPKNEVAALVVDHHPVADPEGSLCGVIDVSAGATSVILAEALLKVGAPIPTGLATALVYGIVSETQNLSRETRDRDIRVYRKLFPLADIRLLAAIQNPQRPVQFFRILRGALDNAFMAGSMIGAHLGEVDTPDRVSQTADFLLTCEGTRWAVCTGRYRGRLHVSLRATRPGLHSGRLLQAALGAKDRAGGHWTMAGGALRMKPSAGSAAWSRMEKKLIRGLIRLTGTGRFDRIRRAFRP